MSTCCTSRVFSRVLWGRLPGWLAMGVITLLGLAVTNQAAAQTHDFGDYSRFPSASSQANSNLRLGALVDAESSAQLNATATGDDNHNTRDEDGVILPASFQQGESATIQIIVTNRRNAGTAYLNVWIDWNNNGSLNDSGEQVASNLTVANGTLNATRTITVTVPANAVIGDVGMRVRLTSVTTPGPDGVDGFGEVEDHMITVSASLGIGNLVWNDTNDNGLKDANESGINNVLVELWNPGADNAIGGTGANADTLVATTTTANGGIYGFSNLTAGRYYVKIPTPPLSRVSSVVDGTDNGEDDDNDGSQPGGSGTAAYSPVIQLAARTEPGSTGTGNVDNTIDFGFVANVGAPFVCDNRFYIMQNVETSAGSNKWDTTLYYIESDQTLVPLFIYTGKKLNGLAAYGGYLYCIDQNGGNLYRINSLGTLVDMGEIDGLPNSATDGQWGGATALTSGLMIINRYTFANARTTLYTVDLGSASLVGTPVITKYSTTNQNTTGNFGDIVWDPLTGKIYGYNTNDASNLGLFEINTTTGICTRVAASALTTFGSLVIDANGLAYGYGSQSSSTAQDTLYVFNRTNGVLNGSLTKVGTGRSVSNSDGAACPGAPASMKLGNHVWHDANNNGTKDSGEAGINGVEVRLFLGGEDPLTAQPAAVTTTANGGVYMFDNLSPGQYFVYIPTPPAAFPLSSTTTTTSDNGRDNDDNGIQTAAGQPTRSPLISLAAGTEPTNDGDDSNSDQTIDFGFLACPSITISGTPANATPSTSYTHTFTASGGFSPYTWTLASGSLPSGFTLSSAGVLSGSSSTSSSSSITVRVTDSVGCQATLAVTFVVAANTDFGDYAPFASASSTVDSTLRMGALVDSETTATVNNTASGDDITGVDDEDGVTVSGNFEQGKQASINVTVTNTRGSTAFLNVWVDFNRNGSLTDSGEQVATNITIPNGTSNAVRTISFTVPANASLGASALRARLTNVATPGPTGASGFGEVEDHPVSIVSPLLDYGDFAAFGEASHFPDATLSLGTLLDVEASANTNATATGDDLNGIDDEDGVTMPASIDLGATVTIPVQVLNNTGGTVYLHSWIDFNNDGVLNNAPVSAGGEKLETARAITAATRGSILREWWTGIGGSVVTDLTNNAAYPNNPTGSDQRFSFETPTDWADNMGQRMRGWVYPPTTGNYTFWIASDDEGKLYLSSDENAANAAQIATVPSWTSSRQWTSFTQQKSVSIPLVAGRAYYIEAIMKEGGGGDNLAVAWELPGSGTGPVVIAGEYLSPWSAGGPALSTQNITFTVPSNASVGPNRGVRFRVSNTANTIATGYGGIGEVEDYTVNILQATTDFGDWDGAPNASSTANTNLRLGALVDTEVVPTRNANATGDDDTDQDDEDGVTLPTNLGLGSGGTLGVTLNNTFGSSAFLNAWIDFNGNGNFDDSGEQVITNTVVANNTRNAVRNFNFNVPSNAKPGVRGVRVRLTNVRDPGSTGHSGIGEVEDYVLTINCPTLNISPSSITTPVVGKNFGLNFSSGGGVFPHTYRVVSGNLPAGLTLSSGGLLSGIATSTDSMNFTVAATDANGCFVTQNYTVTPVCPRIPLSPSSLQNPSVGSFYSQTITASDGSPPYTFTLSSGTLPAGITLGANTGTFSGTPTQSGPFSFTLLVTDAYGCTASGNYSMNPTCSAVSMSPSSLSAMTVGTSFSQTMSGAGGVAPYSFSISSGVLPAGITLSSSGVISGTPTSSASSSFIIRIADSRGCAGTRAFSVKPSCPNVTITTTTLPTAYVGNEYSTILAASPGVAPFTWSMAGGALPDGLTLSASGVISGIPTAVVVSGSVTFRVTDSAGCEGTRTLNISSRRMAIGNLVWLDNNNNGLRDSGENGVAGALVQLFSPGTDNAIGGTGSAADTQVGETFTTAEDGAYIFTNILPGNYYVKVTPPRAYTHTSGTPATSDNNVDNNNDGAQPGGPGTPLFSPIIALQPGTESTTDGDGDPDTNLTVDFGLWAPMAVGNMVFMDINGDGRMNANEGIQNVFVQIFREGANVRTDAAVSAAITDEKGRYLITDLNPGSYFIHLAAIQFQTGGVLKWAKPLSQVVPGDDNVGQNLIFNNNPDVNGASTAVFTLIPGQLPAGSAESGAEGVSDDDGVDENTDLTIDLGLICPDCSDGNQAMIQNEPAHGSLWVVVTPQMIEDVTNPARSTSAGWVRRRL